jgi:aspartyl-tRNA(Asn)/glutamyl-tRNA(Gln) amidotransferase subunit A
MSSVPLAGLADSLRTGVRTAVGLIEDALSPDDFGATEWLLPHARADAGAAAARWAAGNPLGDFDGIPFAVKSNIDVAGVPTTSGTALNVPPARHDAAVVDRLRSAGFIPARTATMAELAIGSVTDNPHTGTCCNPRNRALSAGGSSGGSAALVAAGLVPFALGSDTMGSVRIPAAYCGICAYKPSRGAIDSAGLTALYPLLDTVGVLAPEITDLIAVAKVVSDLDSVPVQNYSSCTVGVPTLTDLADDDGRRALDVVTAVLRSLGITVIPVSMDVDPAVIRRRGLLLCEEDTYRRFADAVDNDDPGLSAAVRGLLRFGAAAPADKVRAAEETLSNASAAVDTAFESVDFMVLPTTPEGPPLVGHEPSHAGDLTAWANVAGVPAVAFPAGSDTAAGMPRGVQLIGRRGADAGVLALAATVAARALNEVRA